MTTLAKPRELSSRTRRGRAINSIAEFLRSSLTVPNIYLEPRIQGHLDLLAVDRGGGGDLHGVEIKITSMFASSLRGMHGFIGELKDYPTHYRYLALPRTEVVSQLLPRLQLFSQDGIGRIGILLLSELEDGPPSVELAVKPERYRVSATDMTKVDRFLSKNRPDIEVRI